MEIRPRKELSVILLYKSKDILQAINQMFLTIESSFITM